MSKTLFVLTAIAAATVAIWYVSDRQTAPPISTVAPPITSATAKRRPPCGVAVNPAVTPPLDCVPPPRVKLPPDPGPEGMKTLLGVTTNPEGVRDDVYIRVWQKYGYSERAVRALLGIAKQHQAQIEMGNSVSVEVAQEFMRNVTMKAAACYMKSVDEETINSGASEDVGIMVKNTPERWMQAKKHARLLHGSGFELDQSPLTEQCGYDPAKLPD